MQTTAINRLTESQTVIERVPVYAESGGIVASLQVREGDFIKPGTPILRLQSYSGVWIIASVPEQDLALVDTGMPVRLSFPSAPGAPAEGRINYIYPEIDPKTRTGEVRIEVDNAAGYLRPGAYADISMDLGGEPRLSVPTEAVLRDSRGSHIILALGDGRFAGRTIQTGLNASQRVSRSSPAASSC
jgi:Cu(I)/Ag(I) efflux system membrane fusion protein